METGLASSSIWTYLFQYGHILLTPIKQKQEKLPLVVKGM